MFGDKESIVEGQLNNQGGDLAGKGWEGTDLRKTS